MRARLLCGLAAALVITGILQATPACSADAFVFDEKANALTHLNSGFVFPYRIADFEGGADVRQYDPSGNDVSVPYNLVKDDYSIAITVYVYAIPTPKSGQNTDAVLREHFEGLKADILETYKEATLSSEGDFVVQKKKGRKASFRITFPQLTFRSNSELYLLIHKNWFVKYRVSYPTSAAATASQHVSRFLNAASAIYSR